MLKRIFIGALAVVAALGVYVALQPSEFRIHRSAIVVADPATVFAEVNDFRKWDAWSPWAKVDPNSKTTFEGPEQGEGAVFHWAGNAEVGEGRLTIVESKPTERIRIRTDFDKPFKGTSTSEFTFKGDGPRTVVTWSMSGERSFIEKAICLVMNPERMIGDKFEQGLASLKSVSEAKLG